MRPRKYLPQPGSSYTGVSLSSPFHCTERRGGGNAASSGADGIVSSFTLGVGNGSAPPGKAEGCNQPGDNPGTKNHADSALPDLVHAGAISPRGWFVLIEQKAYTYIKTLDLRHVDVTDQITPEYFYTFRLMII